MPQMQLPPSRACSLILRPGGVARQPCGAAGDRGGARRLPRRATSAHEPAKTDARTNYQHTIMCESCIVFKSVLVGTLTAPDERERQGLPCREVFQGIMNDIREAFQLGLLVSSALDTRAVVCGPGVPPR